MDLTQLQSLLLGPTPGTVHFVRWRLGFHAELTVFSSGAGFPEHPGGVKEDRAAVQTVLWSHDRQRQHGRHIHQSAQSNRDAIYWTAVGTGQLGLLAATSQTLRTWTMIFFCCLLQSNIFLLKGRQLDEVKRLSSGEETLNITRNGNNEAVKNRIHPSRSCSLVPSHYGVSFTEIHIFCLPRI